jgi:lysyl-tRNA synthetase class 2
MSDKAAAVQNPATAITNPREAKEHKLSLMKAAGLDPYPHKFDRTHKAGELQENYKDLAPGTETDTHVAVAGRIMAMRNNGLFLDINDPTGKIQVFCHKDSMPEDQLAKLSFMDIGDIIGAKGTIRRTPRGELSVRATQIDVLTKSLQPLPEKYHGLTDVEQRYRQRYLDLIMNDESRQKLLMRSKIISTIRRFMEQQGAIEVETPMMHPILGGASARPFKTHHNALDAEFFLRIAPELYLKRLIVGGLADAVFEINRNFRNEGISFKHNPEFTMLEAYHAYKDYNDIMDLVEKVVQEVAMAVHGTLEVPFEGQVINLASPWARKSMVDLVKEETGIDFMPMDAGQAHEAAKKIGVHVDPKANWGQVVEAIFGEKVEHKLIQPTHVIDHPLDISPLSKVHRGNDRLVERFESYINGWELANAFTELNDPKIQYDRFMDQVAQREDGNEEAMMVDHDFVAALEYGLPPTGGWGMGIDRLVMLMTNSHNIREVIAFPTLKPIKD